MAYIDKITTMRRFALIKGDNGNIFSEGVNIEGIFVHKLVSDDEVLSLNETEMKEFIADSESALVYQDAEDEGHWEPRTFDPSSAYYEGAKYKLPDEDRVREDLDRLSIR